MKKRKMAITSLLALQAINNLSEKRRAVYDYISVHQPCHNLEIAEGLGWPLNCVTGRVTDLVELGLAQVEEIGLNNAGRKVKYWSTADPGDRIIERIAKNEPKFDQDGVRIKASDRSY